jgi:hypothetical protein
MIGVEQQHLAMDQVMRLGDALVEPVARRGIPIGLESGKHFDSPSVNPPWVGSIVLIHFCLELAQRLLQVTAAADLPRSEEIAHGHAVVLVDSAFLHMVDGE